jgi:DnaK suppressor protein
LKKSVAKKATQKKPAASKKTAPAKKAAAAKKAAVASKPGAARKAVKPAAATRTGAATKPAPRPTSAPARPAPVKAQAASRTPKPAAPKPAAHKPAAHKPAAPAKTALSVAAPAATGALVAHAPPPRKSGRGASKYIVAQAPMPLPAPTSRFADRFAPPRPPTRQMNNLELDVPRHAQKSDPKLANAWKSKTGRELSEAEVLAMPESEYMNEKQLEFFRGKLQQLKDDLLSNAGETTEHLREDTSIVPDPADRATIEEEHALELRTRDRERKLLKKISQSLARIESGEYGFCDETGEPIGLGRLIARPTATLSLEAQQRRELKQKMFGD